MPERVIIELEVDEALVLADIAWRHDQSVEFGELELKPGDELALWRLLLALQRLPATTSSAKPAAALRPRVWIDVRCEHAIQLAIFVGRFDATGRLDMRWPADWALGQLLIAFDNSMSFSDASAVFDDYGQFIQDARDRLSGG